MAEPAASDRPLAGQVMVITGASDGIGAAAAGELARRGATLAVVGRSPEKTALVAQRTGARPFVCDFARLAEVRRLAEQLAQAYPRIDLLANNAGLLSNRRVLTEDGHELTFQVNHLAPFLLTNLLAQPLGQGGRVLATASRAQYLAHLDLDDLESAHRYRPFRVYGATKLENVLFTKELARRWAERGVATAAFHPGTVRTAFGRRGGLGVTLAYSFPLRHLLLVSPERGASTLVWLASTAPGRDWRSGDYFARRRPAGVPPQAMDPQLAARLWDRSAELAGLA